MKGSLRGKIIYLLTGLILFTIVLTWFLNKTFLEDYYLHSKMKAIDASYSEIKENYKGNLGEDDQLSLQRLASNKNVDIYIFEKDGIYIFTNYLYSDYSGKDDGQRNIEQVNDLIKEYWYSGSNPDIKDKEILKEKVGYKIYGLYDTRLQTNYIDLVNEDRTVILRTSLESIQESVGISNKFLAYMGVLSILIGSLIVVFASKKITKPVLDLSDIAKKMSDLDFNEKYQVKTKDEIGVLGNSINVLSDRLENNISKLKNANNELAMDIKNKNKIDEMRQEFLSNISHELKTPISLIQGYAEGLKENINESPESRDYYCEVIMDEAKKMDDMVQKLLSLNQIEYSNETIAIERFDIVELVYSVVESSRILMEKKDIFLYYEEQEPIYIWSDPFLIEGVVQNYINNAINHTSHSKVIEVKIIKLNNSVRVSVFNTGEQIPEKEINRIWDKFYKVDKARTREYGGSGIGLSIVKAIMNSLDHKFGVSNREKGVEFWFEIEMNS